MRIGIIRIIIGKVKDSAKIKNNTKYKYVFFFIKHLFIVFSYVEDFFGRNFTNHKCIAVF